MTTTPTAHSSALDPTLATAAQLTSGVNGWEAAGAPDDGVDSFSLIDGPLGVVSRTMDERDHSTLFPSGAAIAASWSVENARAVGAEMGREARERGIAALLGPNLGLPRNPFSGRGFEMYSEEAILTGVLARSLIEGIQSSGVAAVPKHLVGNDTETDRRTMDARIPETVLREDYLLPFEYALKGGAQFVMTAYNSLNGVPCVEDRGLIDILRDEWDWDGVVVSDWYGITDGVASATAGVDLEMPGPPRQYGQALLDAVADGRLDPITLRAMGDRIRRFSHWRTGAPALTERTGSRAQLLTDAAVAGTVLVQNRKLVDGAPALPVPPGSVRRIALLGPLAQHPTLQGGTFAQVSPTQRPAGLADAMTALYSDTSTEVIWAQGVAQTAFHPVSTLSEGDVEVRYLRSDGTVETEHRPGSSYVWFHRVPLLGPTAEPGIVEIRATIVPRRDGDHAIAISGSGILELAVDGETVARREAPGRGDIMGAVARAEPTIANVALRIGVPTVLTARVTFTPSHVQALGLTVREPEPGRDALLREAEEAAAAADVAVIVVGDDASTSRESADLETTRIHPDQEALIRAVSASHDRVVVIVNSGRATDADWADEVEAVLYSWYGGEQVSAALAGVLSGEVEPGGRLPVTVAFRDSDHPGYLQRPDAQGRLDYARSEPLGHRWFQKGDVGPRWSIGSGSGYTSFSEDFVVNEDGRARVTVTNTGARRGRHLIQLWIRPADEQAERLGAFEWVELDPGATSTAELELPARVLQRWDSDARQWTAGANETFVVALGPDAAVRPTRELTLTRAIRSHPGGAPDATLRQGYHNTRGIADAHQD